MSDLTAVATVQQLGDRLGRDLEGAEARRAEAVIADVSAVALSITGQAWDSPFQVPGEIVAVVLAAARRVFTNPDGFVSQSVGPFSNTRAAGAVSSDVFVASELAVLKAFKARKPLWTLSTTRGDADHETGFVTDDRLGSDAIPYIAGGDPGEAAFWRSV
jgi:hypothetical protein